MMNRMKYMAAALGVVLLAGCTASELVTTVGDERQAPLFASRVQTRATATAFEADDAIGIYMVQAGKALSAQSIVEGTANRHYTTANGSGFAPHTATETVYFPKDNAAVDFISYYPRAANVSGEYTLPVSVTNQTDLSAIDLMYSNNATGRVYTTPATELVFEHRLSRLVFNLKPGKGLTDAVMPGTTITLKGMNTSADFSLVTGALSVKVSVADIAVPTATTGMSAQAIVLPGKGEGTQFVFVVNGEPFYYSLTANDGLAAGEQYTYNVTLNRIENAVTGKIENWTEVSREIEVEP